MAQVQMALSNGVHVTCDVCVRLPQGTLLNFLSLTKFVCHRSRCDFLRHRRIVPCEWDFSLKSFFPFGVSFIYGAGAHTLAHIPLCSLLNLHIYANVSNRSVADTRAQCVC